MPLGFQLVFPGPGNGTIHVNPASVLQTWVFRVARGYADNRNSGNLIMAIMKLALDTCETAANTSTLQINSLQLQASGNIGFELFCFFSSDMPE